MQFANSYPRLHLDQADSLFIVYKESGTLPPNSDLIGLMEKSSPPVIFPKLPNALPEQRAIVI